ncbi:S-4TM family putative pore-forming effector [Streptomyces solincola]|uniref:S-4TM family putative pore-forming effector n=1 Tax=Streptomyces solincola TaxID=2100817 RepID=UPI0011B25117|nr:S-4TM family putative pore-forming effector [Streptomyces solincola]
MPRQAVEGLRRVLDAEVRAGGPLAVKAVKARFRLVHWLVADGRPDEALAVLAELLDRQREALPAGADALLDTRLRVGDVRLLAGDARGAVDDFRAALAEVPDGAGPAASRKALAIRRRVAHALEAARDPAGSADAWDQLADALETAEPGKAAAARQHVQVQDVLLQTRLAHVRVPGWFFNRFHGTDRADFVAALADLHRRTGA